MGRKKHKIIVIGKLREFDEAAWKRLLLAYVYHLHDEQLQREVVAEAAEGKDQVSGGGS